MTSQPDPHIDAAIRDAFERVHRVTAAHRILPEHLKQYAHVDTVELDWLGLVERVDRPPYHFMADETRVHTNESDRAAVAIIAHLLGFEEALRVAPADTFMGLLELLDRSTRVEVLSELTILHAMIDL